MCLWVRSRSGLLSFLRNEGLAFLDAGSQTQLRMRMMFAQMGRVYSAPGLRAGQAGLRADYGRRNVTITQLSARPNLALP